MATPALSLTLSRKRARECGEIYIARELFTNARNRTLPNEIRLSLHPLFCSLAVKPLDKSAGFNLTDQAGLDKLPRIGAAGTRVTFTHLSQRKL